MVGGIVGGWISVGMVEVVMLGEIRVGWIWEEILVEWTSVVAILVELTFQPILI
jgi:hypothetical protein